MVGEHPVVGDGAWAPVDRADRVACGDVRIGPHCWVLFGAALSAEGGAVELGERCIIMENAVLGGTPGDPLRLGNNVLIGPRAYLTGCTVEASVFLATGITVFNGARIGTRSESASMRWSICEPTCHRAPCAGRLDRGRRPGPAVFA